MYPRILPMSSYRQFLYQELASYVYGNHLLSRRRHPRRPDPETFSVDDSVVWRSSSASSRGRSHSWTSSRSTLEKAQYAYGSADVTCRITKSCCSLSLHMQHVRWVLYRYCPCSLSSPKQKHVPKTPVAKPPVYGSPDAGAYAMSDAV